MFKRIITGTCVALVAILLLVLSGTFLYPVGLSLLSTMGVFEYLRAIGLVANWRLTAPSFLCSFTAPMLGYFIKDAKDGILWLFGALVVCYFSMTLLSLFSKEENGQRDNASAFWGTMYITVGFAAMAILYRTVPGGGILLTVPVFLAAWITDTFAYFTGVFFGKHKLCPAISPKKTVEGSLGGILFATLSFLCFGLAIDLWWGYEPSYLLLGICGALLSVLAQLGDLTMSKVKREHGVKDFGTLLPGHGGVLDRFDSFLSVSPVHLLFVLATGGFALFV